MALLESPKENGAATEETVRPRKGDRRGGKKTPPKRRTGTRNKGRGRSEMASKKKNSKSASQKKKRQTEAKSSHPRPVVPSDATTPEKRALSKHGEGVPVSRVEAFRTMAEARARGLTIFVPRHQTGNDRRLHLRQTIREDHESRIHRGPHGAQRKFQKLAGSLFAFFRGTALLFYRDMVSEDAWSPTVLALGDVHPENFGVMPSADNVPFFGVNDFDEAYFAPFTWDVKRGATGFLVACHEQGLSGKKSRKIMRHFVRGYVDGLRDYASNDRELSQQLRIDNSPKDHSEVARERSDEAEQIPEEVPRRKTTAFST